MQEDEAHREWLVVQMSSRGSGNGLLQEFTDLASRLHPAWAARNPGLSYSSMEDYQRDTHRYEELREGAIVSLLAEVEQLQKEAEFFRRRADWLDAGPARQFVILWREWREKRKAKELA